MANISFAGDMRYYDVEVIVIENLSEEQKNSENWPLQVNLTLPEKTVQLGEPVPREWLPEEVDLKLSYKVLSPRTYQLKNEVERIAKSKTQRVIFHTAWRQPGLDKNQALPIYFKREVPAAPPVEDDNSSSLNDEITSTSDTNKADATSSILEGLLRVTLARYLHLEAELTYRDTPPAIVKSDNPFSILDNENERNKVQKQGVIHLKQKRRRIRSNELHYIDHPVLGILIRITPYEKPEDLTNKVKKK
ncbi:MAG: peptidoglycan binding protein CsiV [Gammaproteobacteria bacterium]|nr:MAG: peptidoglycan binding protein CsiV [Gammaproteobacteria bacterium]